MRTSIPLTLAIMAAVGCTHVQLERSTTNQVSTLTDLQYTQVLDNVAMFSKNSEAVPFFAVVTTGNAQITDSGQTTDFLQPNSPAVGIWTGKFGLQTSRAIQETWGLVPLTDPDKLKRMRCAYQILVNYQNTECDDCRKDLARFFCRKECPDEKNPSRKNKATQETCDRCLACAVPPGWFCTGPRKAVPKNACHVGHYCDTYAWVSAEGLRGQSLFTLSMLDIATTASHADTEEVKKIYLGEPEPNKKALVTVVSTTEEIAPESGKAGAKIRIHPLLLQQSGILPPSR